jgi:hypothetical protein
LSRADLLSRGAKGGVALVVAGSAVSVLAPEAAAESLSDDDLAFARYRNGTFDSAASITKLAEELETTMLGAYLGAIAGMQSSNLIGQIARIAANEAQHLSVFQGLALGRPINVSVPVALTIEQASDAMAAFTG